MHYLPGAIFGSRQTQRRLITTVGEFGAKHSFGSDCPLCPWREEGVEGKEKEQSRERKAVKV